MTAARWRALAKQSETARSRAHAPYSSYQVGAALLTTKGVVLGCNVENASYPLCICAEAAAVARAVSQGWRSWVALAVATEGPEPGAPCGACRQIVSEFADRDLPVGLVVGGEVRRIVTMRELLPLAFDRGVLEESQQQVAKRPRRTLKTK